MNKNIIGWNEWCSLPDANISAIKAKIDTGARTSCLHAFEINEYYFDSKLYINFSIHPVQNNNKVILKCHALVIDQKTVTNSGGASELRYFIRTTLVLGDHSYTIDLNLTNRDDMKFRMLIGREALEKRFVVDSSKRFLTGKISKGEIDKIYDIQSMN